MVKIVVSIAKARELDDLGWKKETVFKLGLHGHNVTVVHPKDEWCIKKHKDLCSGIFKGEPLELDAVFPAPTAEEILEELPTLLQGLPFEVEKEGSLFIVQYGNTQRGAPSLADAAAMMWIFLKENNLLPNSK